METSERKFLLEGRSFLKHIDSGLSVTFAAVCVIDVFGVFPIVALPKAIIDCGIAGVLLITIVCSLQIYTAVLLGRCWVIAEEVEPTIQFKNRYPYSALAEITYGKRLSRFVTVLLDLTVFGAGVPNLILSSQNLQFLGLKLTNNSFDISFCYWMIVMGLVTCPLLWCGSPKDMKLLCTISVTLVFSVFLLLFGSIIMDKSENATINYLGDFTLWQNLFKAYGIITFQFDIHPIILTIQMDMNNKTKVNKAVVGGFLISLGIFVVVGISIYVRYGNQIGPSILEMLPSTVFVHLAAVLVAVQLTLTSAISNSALYQHIEDCLGIPREFNQRRCIVRSVLAVLSILVAESVPSFDVVMSLLGGTLTGPLVFILPPLFYLKMLKLNERHLNNLKLETVQNIAVDDVGSFQDSMSYVQERTIKRTSKTIEMLFCGFIIIIGCCATVATTYWNVIDSIRYIKFSPPCIVGIYNSTIGK
ncbi:hypothetical protein RN001_008417 [Aquatica leii]|uniref:Amino acid transporter transmembrane domain-containing protein n=1 Tax=Aquatica leii TaxID=1421715 RepID=A0AAN7PD98_9COLE|nr:hypothetical protein RN001_008417 [Aquatica leii]